MKNERELYAVLQIVSSTYKMEKELYVTYVTNVVLLSCLYFKKLKV